MRDEVGGTVPVEESEAVPHPARRLLVAVPDLAIAAAFLLTWLDPFRLGEGTIHAAGVLMAVEFVLVQATAMTGGAMLAAPSPARKTQVLLGFGLVYLLFALGISLEAGAWWPIFAVALLTLNRILAVLLGNVPVGRRQGWLIESWKLAVFWFMVSLMAAALLPLPELGVTADVRRTLDLSGREPWANNYAQQVLAWGVLYYGITGLSEILGWPYALAARNERLRKEGA